MTLFPHLPETHPKHPQQPHPSLVAAPTAADALPQDGRDDDVDRLPLRCLIVDDNSRFLETARLLLEREELTVAGVAATGAEALVLAATERPDVVLVDVMLGTESGFEIARRLVENDPDGRTTVILISTHAEADFAELIEATPAAGFLAKSELSATAIRTIHDSHPR